MTTAFTWTKACWNGKVHDLGACLHRIAGLEQLPTLFLNSDSFQRTSQDYPTRFLGFSWKVEADVARFL